MIGLFDKTRLRDFGRDQNGAITVDWVVLTAAAVFLGLGSAFLIATSVPEVAEGLGNYMGNLEPGDGSAFAQAD